MQSITFECEVITPMFLAGADGVTPELRPPSIKGALRFWWRALNGHLVTKKNERFDYTQLKVIEGKIFGDTSHRSNLIIRESKTSESNQFLEYDDFSEAQMLPHKSSKKTEAFPEKITLFGINLGWKRDIQIDDYLFTFQDLKNLFKTVCCLGGFGKRSRRGFGSVSISRIKTNDGEWEDYLMPTTLNRVNELLGSKFELNNDIIASQNFSGGYPYVVSIEFGDNDNDITKKIINDSHEVKKKELRRAEQEAIGNNKYYHDRNGKRQPDAKKYSNFDNAIGNGGRFASPIYVSTINTLEGQKSIITTLNSVPKRPNRNKLEEYKILQGEYKNRLKNNNNG